MPKVVDHAARRRDITDALLRVVQRDGARAVSVRTVAEESGLSVGSLRNTFTSQSALLGFAMATVAERVAARVQARTRGSRPGIEELTDLCGEVLPLDRERRAEAEVWLEFVVLARTDPELGGLSSAAHEGLRRLATGVVAAVLGATDPERLADEAARLHALLDGLALHGVLHPQQGDPARARATVRAHLARLGAG